MRTEEQRSPRPRRVAVVGSGVAGLLAAHVIAKQAQVTLLEADRRLGGHAHTQDVEVAGQRFAVDTGFIVHNRQTYPTLLRLFDELSVATQPTEMSMSVRCDQPRLEYAGGKGAVGLFGARNTLRQPAYWRMLAAVPRFHRLARALLAAGPTAGVDDTLEDFLDAGRFDAFFREYFVAPLVAAVWSCDPDRALEYPARYLFRFLAQHGMLSTRGAPRWRTVVGGSRVYVDRLAAGLQQVRTGAPVGWLRQSADGVELGTVGGPPERYDAVVVATHPEQALSLLAEPTPAQREVLGALPYTTNDAQVHTDTSVLPRSRAVRASWNYWHRPAGSGLPVMVSYDLTRLQRLATPGGRRVLVTLGGADRVRPDAVLGTVRYEHPQYTPRSVAARDRLDDIATDRVVFAGAYHGWGFHEDGARSGVEAARRLGFGWDADGRAMANVPNLPDEAERDEPAVAVR